MKLNKSLFAVPFLLAATMTQAGSISHTGLVDLQKTDLANVLVAASLAKFDSSTGVLTSVVISYTGNATSDITTTNTSNDAGKFKSTTDFDFSLSSTDAGVNGLLSGLSFADSVTTGSLTTIAAGATQAFPTLNYSNTVSVTFTSAGDLAKFIGSGISTLGSARSLWCQTPT